MRAGVKRFLGVIGLALVAASGLVLAQTKPSTSGLATEEIEISARQIDGFARGDPQKLQFGRLTWRGGLVLTSPNANFGGWSGLALDPNGEHLFAVSDAGTWMSARIGYEEARPAALTQARLGPIFARDGSALSRSRDRDAEGVAFIEGGPARGSLYISFEQNDRIGRFTIDEKGLAPPSRYLSMPEATRNMKLDGFEAVTVMRGGRFKGALLAFSERRHGTDRVRAGWIWAGGKLKRISITDIGGFDLTDIASLPDGRLAVLERRFRWSEGVRMRVRLIDAEDIKAGAALAGETLLEADLASEIDNMEGLAVHADADGTVVLTLISDDNFNRFLQRTILLQFALDARNASTRAAATRAP